MKTIYIKFSAILCCLATLSGCNPDLAKSVDETDKKVYNIIDSTWNNTDIDEHNQYRITDSENISTLSEIRQLLASDNKTLPLSSALIIAVKNNRQYQQQKEQLYLTALDQVQVEHIYEGSWLAGGESYINKTDDETALGNDGSIAFNKLLATGARISSELSIGCIDIISGDLRSGLSVVASAAITQPLLRGAGRKVALENLTQSQRNTLYQIRNFNLFRQNFVTEIITDYYNILLVNEIQENYAQQYDIVNDFYEKLKTRATAGRVSSHELEQAQQDVVQTMTDYISAKKRYEDDLAEFKHKLILPPDLEIVLDNTELKLLKEHIAAPLELTEDKAIELALTQRLDLLNAADISDDAERKVEVAADAIRTELNLVGLAQNETSEQTTFGFGSSNLRQTQQRYSLALEVDLPFDRVAETNAYRKSLIDVIKAQRNQQELTEKIALEIRENYRRIFENKELYNNEINGMNLATKRSANTVLSSRYGRTNTRDVLDAQKDLLQAKNQSVEALVNYAISNLDLIRNTGLIKLKDESSWYKPLSRDYSMVK